MLAKARKSSFNANIGEFCSVTFVCLFVCLFFFLWRLRLLGFCFEFRHMRLSALIEQIFGVHGVQEMFLRLSTFV